MLGFPAIAAVPCSWKNVRRSLYAVVNFSMLFVAVVVSRVTEMVAVLAASSFVSVSVTPGITSSTVLRALTIGRLLTVSSAFRAVCTFPAVPAANSTLSTVNA